MINKYRTVIINDRQSKRSEPWRMALIVATLLQAIIKTVTTVVTMFVKIISSSEEVASRFPNMLNTNK